VSKASIKQGGGGNLERLKGGDWAVKNYGSRREWRSDELVGLRGIAVVRPFSGHRRELIWCIA
jgi:hypothetical protein